MAICPNCGKDTRKNKVYCSQACRAEYLKNKRRCIVCGKMFWAAPSSGKITCSVECERANRSISGKTGASAVNAAKAQEAAKSSPNSGRYETNAIAKSWKIRSPEGIIYDVNNLSLWADEHADILPSDPKRFALGIRDIKRTIQGKKERGSTQYKGWTLLEWSEDNKAREGLPPIPHHPKRTCMSDDERLQRKRYAAKIRYQEKQSKITPGE